MKVTIDISNHKQGKDALMEFEVRDSRSDEFMLELLKLKRNFLKHPQFQ